MQVKSDFKKIIFSIISRFSYQIFSMLIMFLLTPFVIKKLGDYQYGLWVLVTVFVNYMGYTELGVTSAIQRNLSVAAGDKNDEEFNKIHNNGLLLNCIIFLLVNIITAVVIVIINILHFKQYHLISILIAIMGFNLALSFPFKSYYGVLSANIRFDIIAGIQAAQIFLTSVMTVLIILKGYGLIGLAIGTLIVMCFINCLFWFFAKKISSFLVFQPKLINKSTIKKLLNYSGKTVLAQISDIVRFKLDEVVTGTFISINMVTIYSVANKLNGSANSFSGSFLGILTPLFSKYINVKNDKDKVKLFLLMSKIPITISFLTFFGFLFLGKPFIKIWMGEHYINSYYPLIILALGYFTEYMQSAGVSYMYSTDTHQYFAYMSVSEGILNLILSLIFVIHFKLGINGVALGTLIPMLITKTTFHPILVSKILKIKAYTYYAFFGKCIFLGIVPYSLAGLLTLMFNIDSYLKIACVAGLLALIAVFHFVLMLNKEEKTIFSRKILVKFPSLDKRGYLTDNAE